MENPVGTVIQIKANYYFVNYKNLIFLCKLRSKIKKRKLEVKVGDKVILEEVCFEKKTAVISDILLRNNDLNRPNIANIDQIVIVMSTYQPKFNSLILDRLLVNSSFYNIKAFICINKLDLDKDEKVRNEINDIYFNLNYPLYFISALNYVGIDLFKQLFKNKITVLTGPSGVGKSTILNILDHDLNLKTSEIQSKHEKGKHTTRHVSLYKIKIDEDYGFIVDTPGFSFTDLGDIEPADLGWFFPEFVPYIPECKFKRCLHWQEPECKVKEKININSQRYLNYLNILYELQDKQKKRYLTKQEVLTKTKLDSHGKEIKLIKLGILPREDSRRVKKQKLTQVERNFSLDDIDTELFNLK